MALRDVLANHQSGYVIIKEHGTDKTLGICKDGRFTVGEVSDRDVSGVSYYAPDHITVNVF